MDQTEIGPTLNETRILGQAKVVVIKTATVINTEQVVCKTWYSRMHILWAHISIDNR